MPFMIDIPISVLDLSPICEGSDAGQALRNTLDLARHAEGWGYNRYWLAEHHNMPGIASAATAVVIGQVAAATTTLRVGAGGVMLPNHAPLVIAEQYGTLAALYPGRIELGLGRAPGTDQHTAHALRRTLTGSADDFPRDVLELQHYFKEPEPGQVIRAVPGAGLDVPLWILGSSLFGAQLAAALGLPYAFASHFAPAAMMQAIAVYRERFEPSEQLDRPYVMLGMNVIAADTDEEAAFLRSSVMQSFVNLRRGRPGKLPPPVENYAETLMPAERMMLDEALSCSAWGSPQTVERDVAAFIARTGADEIMMTCHIHDHAKRLKSFELVSQHLFTADRMAAQA
jgi:luciferase family oxidoreductase group 1